MSVRNALLALVAQQPAGVYRLKQMFEEQTCGAWPLNIGQVYQTMQRLERDGQVVSHAETNAGRDSEVFELTDAGREVLAAWWSTPVPREHPERDELVMKLAVAAADPTVDVEAMIQTQRRSSLSVIFLTSRPNLTGWTTSSPARSRRPLVAPPSPPRRAVR